MTVRRPLVTAAAITGVAVLVGGVLGAGALALVGYPAGDGVLAADSVWSGRDGTAGAAAAADRRAMTPDDASAVALLSRAGAASDGVAYSGVTLTTGGATATPIRAQVTGIPAVGTIVATAGGSAVLAGQGRSGSLADASRVLGLLVDNYRVVREAERDKQVAGRSAEAVEAYRQDGSLAARYWIDGGTGLLLRRDLVARNGSTTSSTWFAQLRLGKAAVAHPPPMAADEWSHALDPAARATWRKAGCTCADTLPGGLTLLQARTDDAGAAGGPGHGVVHLLYSDGLTEVSVFDQPGQLDPSATDVLTDKGFQAETYGGIPVLERISRPAAGVSAIAMGEWVWESGSSVLTLVAPATPRASAESRAGQIMAALYVSPASAAASPGGLTTWVPRGWDRVTTAFQQSWDHHR